tara:strand:- start:1574 stop:1846 length:273 start_codon:yes stop_codon:yes gene_type:complete
MKLYTLYIGHNNNTLKRFKEDKINKIISKYFKGYSIQRITGYYEGIKEDSYKIEIITNEDKKVNKLKSFLVSELKQESILKTTALLDIEF